jgi:hypothetical protein
MEPYFAHPIYLTAAAAAAIQHDDTVNREVGEKKRRERDK